MSSSASSNMSFYENAEAFEQFHKYTSYYQATQHYLTEIVQAQPGQLVIECGSATGETTRSVARRYPQATVVGIDFRESIIQEAQRITPKAQYPNLHFAARDMQAVSSYIPWEGRFPDIVYSLYAFHHIPDPIENKYKYAQALFDLPVDRLKVVIADEITEYSGSSPHYKETTLEQWHVIAQEAYRSVYLNRYVELINQGLSHEEADEIASVSASYVRDVELTMAQTTADRNDEYPVSREEMLDIWLEAGFNLVLQAPVSHIIDTIFVFQKGDVRPA